jgi:acyl-CoA dehydrogenase
MYQHLHQLRLMTYACSWKSDRGMNVRNESYMCKYFGDEAAFAAADRAMQIYGALGLTNDLPIELFWREQRANMITEGATEVLKTTLARHILKDYAALERPINPSR